MGVGRRPAPGSGGDLDDQMTVDVRVDRLRPERGEHTLPVLLDPGLMLLRAADGEV